MKYSILKTFGNFQLFSVVRDNTKLSAGLDRAESKLSAVQDKAESGTELEQCIVHASEYWQIWIHLVLKYFAESNRKAHIWTL